MSIYQTIAERILASERILFITGAGISADSGLPTYRGIGGLYNGNATEDNLPIEEALSGQVMRTRPHVTWKYLLQIEQACRGKRFNPAHKIIADIEKLKPDTWVLTQNIDEFHRHAGSKNLIEIHGRVGELFCPSCDFERQVENYDGLTIPPHCPHCGGVIRPRVVLFGEMLPEKEVSLLYEQLQRGFEMVFSIGTTSVFPYIAEPIYRAKHWRALSIEINPGETDVSHFVDVKIPASAKSAMELIWQEMQRLKL
ncbi:MAG TPA: NAD-dependent protein deacylase [Pseudomonadales bacterium]|nr:NAD-dependent protein deacylase [Pseudomonadales bacterium]